MEGKGDEGKRGVHRLMLSKKKKVNQSHVRKGKKLSQLGPITYRRYTSSRYDYSKNSEHNYNNNGIL